MMQNSKNRLISIFTYAASLKIKDNDPLKLIFESIDWSFIYDYASPFYAGYGSPPYDPVSLFKAQLAIYLGEASSNRKLADKINYDGRLCYLCNFDYLRTPDHSVFSRFRNRLGDETFYKIYRTLIAQAVALGVIHGINFAIDSTHIHAYANDKGIKCCNHRGKCACPKTYADPDASWGYKEEDYSFFGYKVHMIVDVDSQLPVDIIVSPGNEHDSHYALPLLHGAKKTENLSVQNYAADSAYDNYEIYRASINDYQVAPYIALNPRSAKDKLPATCSDISFSYKNNCFQCYAGKKVYYAGYEKERNRLKFRCPAAMGRDTCLFKGACYTSEYGRTFHLLPEEDLRIIGRVPRGTPAWNEHYAMRTAAERCNSDAKEQHSLDNLKIRRISAVKIHTYLSLSAMVIKKIAQYAAEHPLTIPAPLPRSPAYVFS